MLSYKYFCTLIAAERINPQGEERADLRAAVQCTTQAQCAGNKDAKPADFMLKFDHEKEKPQTEEQIDIEFEIWSNRVAEIKKMNEVR